MSSVLGRFSLQETARIGCYTPPAEKGKQWIQGEGLRVKLAPISGEPFGSATPSGEITMVIANPASAAVFASAPLGQQFDVLFTPVEPPKPPEEPAPEQVPGQAGE